MTRINKLIAAALICIALPTFAQQANAQLAQQWNIEARSRAERLTSVGVTLLTKRRLLLAVRAFEQATQSDPTDAAPFTMLGMSLAMQGKYDQALDALQKSYSLNRSAEALIDTGFVYYLQHDYDAAITSWNRALELNPKLCQIHGNIGWAKMRKAEFSDAEEEFQKVAKCLPSSNYGYQGIAMVNYLRGNFSAARQAAERAQLTRVYAPVVLLLAKLDALQGDRAGALRRAAAYVTMTRKRNTTDRAMTEFGLPQQHDFFWDPLRVDVYDNGQLLQARMQNPTNWRRQLQLARQGHVDQSISDVRGELLKHPKDLFLLRDLGAAQTAKGDYAGALNTFKMIVDVYPHCYVDLLHIARLAALQGNPQEAQQHVNEYFNHVPGQRISEALANIGNTAEAPPEPPVKGKKTRTKTVRQEAEEIITAPATTETVVKKHREERRESSPNTVPATEF